MLGAPPALANTRFPVASSDVIGREPLEARAMDKPPKQVGRRQLIPSWRSQGPPNDSNLPQPATKPGPSLTVFLNQRTILSHLKFYDDFKGSKAVVTNLSDPQVGDH